MSMPNKAPRRTVDSAKHYIYDEGNMAWLLPMAAELPANCHDDDGRYIAAAPAKKAADKWLCRVAKEVLGSGDIRRVSPEQKDRLRSALLVVWLLDQLAIHDGLVTWTQSEKTQAITMVISACGEVARMLGHKSDASPLCLFTQKVYKVLERGTITREDGYALLSEYLFESGSRRALDRAVDSWGPWELKNAVEQARLREVEAADAAETARNTRNTGLALAEKLSEGAISQEEYDRWSSAMVEREEAKTEEAAKAAGARPMVPTGVAAGIELRSLVGGGKKTRKWKRKRKTKKRETRKQKRKRKMKNKTKKKGAGRPYH